MTYAVVVDWYGPYSSVKAAKEAINKPNIPDELLYLAVGTVSRQRKALLQYVGITNDFASRIQKNHKIRRIISKEGLSLYLGEVSSQRRAGKKAWYDAKNFSKPIYLAESVIAFFLQLPLNSNKRCSPPKESIILLSRWWHTDMETRKRQRPHTDWPDFIEYDDFSDIGTIAWHGHSKRRYFNREAILETAARARAQIAARRAKEAEMAKRKKNKLRSR